MNSSLAFADAARPVRAVVLHLAMRRYSIGHEIILTGERNPIICLTHEDFSNLPAKTQISAVARAAQICCRTWKENESDPLSRWFLFKWRRLNRGADYAVEIALWRNYRQEGSTFPQIGKPEGDGRLLGSPFMARLLSVVGMENIDMPLGMAQWIYFAKAETEGLCRVLNEHESAVDKELAPLKKHGLAALPVEERERLEKLKQEALKKIKCQA